MKITDGSRTVEIAMHEWIDGVRKPDWSNDFLCADKLLHNKETDIFFVPSVEYCLEQAESWKNRTGIFRVKDSASEGLPANKREVVIRKLSENKPFAVNVKELCQRYGMSQTRLAKHFGIPLRSVQRWCGGFNTPPDYLTAMMIRILESGKVIEIKREKKSENPQNCEGNS